MKRYILTIGPSLSNKVLINTIHKNNYIYRINGAHGSVNDIENYILKIRNQVPNADILVDLPGNKIRTKNFDKPLKFEKGKPFKIMSQNFNYPNFYNHLEPGMTVWANDSIFKFKVNDIKKIGGGGRN